MSWPVFEGRQTIAQSIATNTPTAITLDVEDVDTDNGHSTSSNTSRYTVQTAGRFQVSGGVCYSFVNTTGVRSAEVWRNSSGINGAGVAVAPVNGSNTRVPTRTMTVSMVVNDFFEVFAFHLAGVINPTNIVGVDQSTMSARMVGTT